MSMTVLAPALIAALLYITAGVLIARQLTLSAEDSQPEARHAGVLLLSISAIILHAICLSNSLWLDNSLNFGLTTALSIIGWVIAALLLLAMMFRPVENLGVLSFPFAAIAVLLALFWPGKAVLIDNPAGPAGLHLMASILAYSFLALAACQALVLSLQERHLHQHKPSHLLRALPAIETMDKVLFQLIIIGFILLTLTLVSGLFFAETLFNRPLQFNHHTVLAIIAWLIFAALLFGRWRYGWRGQRAARWVISGFAVLLLGYFGSKFVFEVLQV